MENGCHEWKGNTLLPPCLPYGRFKINGKTVGAHRFAWEMNYGKIPNDLWVLHRCDNPRCVNPKHLFLGTPADNVKDCELKNRRHKGPRGKNGIGFGIAHHNSKLNDESVRKIRRMYKHRILGAGRLGNIFGVSKQTIQAVLKGETWGHVR
jgi:hypothetical protein